MSKLVSTAGKGTVTVLETCIPKIVVKADALTKMQLFIENCSEEVGWLGTAYKQDGYVIIDDVFLFDQEVHSTTTEITPEGLSSFAEELLMQENGMEIWNNMKVWGHSHVNMGVTPSGQDNNQMLTFSESGHDWFIRIIANKRGEMKVDLYEYNLGIVFTDLPWKELMSDAELAIMRQIENLQKQLKLAVTEKVNTLEPEIKEEIKAKVRKKTYAPYQYNRTAAASAAANTPLTTGIGAAAATTLPKKTSTTKNNINDIEIWKGQSKKEPTPSVLNSRQDLYLYFSEEDLKDLGNCDTQYQLKQIIETLGFAGTFSSEDLGLIWEETRQYRSKKRSFFGF